MKKFSDIVVKIAQNIINDVERSNKTIKMLAASETARSIVEDANDVVNSLHETISIIKDISNIKKEASGITFQDEMRIFLQQINKINADLQNWKNFPYNAKLTGVSKAQVISTATKMTSELNDLRSTVIAFPKTKLDEKAKNILKVLLSKINIELVEIKKLVSTY